MNLLKHTILILIILQFGLLVKLNAQKVEPVYTDSTGKLFINSGTPVHIYISTNAKGTNALQLQSEQPEGNPLKWGNHGPKLLSYVNLYTGKQIRFDLFADGLPPKTSSAFEPNKGYQKENTIYLSEGALIELSAHDSNSGTQSIFYSVNGSNFSRYENPIAFDSDGKFVIQFYSVDNVGNQEDEGERIIIIDSTPPTSVHQFGGPVFDNIVAKGTTIALSATDETGVKSTHFKLNDGPQAPYTKPIAIGQLPEGEHTIRWYSTDVVGNAEDPKNLTFFVDKTPPLVFEEIVGNNYMIAGREFSSGRSQLRIVGVDNKAGIKDIFYSINGKEFVRYEKPIYLSDISSAITIRSYAIDNVGNRSEGGTSGQQFAMPEVDISGPSVLYSFDGKRVMQRDTLWISPSTLIGISAIDKGSGMSRIEFKLNDQPTVPFSEKFSVNTNGYHRVSVTAFDNVDNLNIVNFGFGVDDGAPEVFYHFSQKPYQTETLNDQTVPVFSQGLTMFLAATDKISGLETISYSINGVKERTYTEPISGFKPGNVYHLSIKAIDKLGNQSNISVQFKVE